MKQPRKTKLIFLAIFKSAVRYRLQVLETGRWKKCWRSRRKNVMNVQFAFSKQLVIIWASFYFHLFSLCLDTFLIELIFYILSVICEGVMKFSLGLKSEHSTRHFWKEFHTMSTTIYSTFWRTLKHLFLVLVFHACDVFDWSSRRWTYFRYIQVCGSEASQPNLLFAGVFAVALLTLLLQAEVHPHTVLLILKVKHAGLFNTMGHGGKSRGRGGKEPTVTCEYWEPLLLDKAGEMALKLSSPTSAATFRLKSAETQNQNNL